MKMWKQWLIKAAIAFGLRQFAKWRDKIDWVRVIRDLEPRIRDFVPGTVLDDQAVSLMRSVIEMLAQLLKDTQDIEKLLGHIAAGDMSAALEVLKDMIKEHFKLPNPFVSEVLEALESESAPAEPEEPAPVDPAPKKKKSAKKAKA